MDRKGGPPRGRTKSRKRVDVALNVISISSGVGDEIGNGVDNSAARGTETVSE